MKTTQGFTLLELLIVISIIAILAGVLIPNLFQAREKANEQTVMAYVRHCINAVEMSRAPGTLALSGEINSCEHPALPALPPKPSAVKNSNVAVNPDNDSYTIEAVSASGRTYIYDGQSILFEDP